MSTHPNAMLLCVIKPNDLSRKTARALHPGLDEDDGLIIGSRSHYKVNIMEDSYDESSQIAADVGDIVVWDFLTYGYGESLEWSKVEALVAELRAWAESRKDELSFTYEIRISANYW